MVKIQIGYKSIRVVFELIAIPCHIVGIYRKHWGYNLHCWKCCNIWFCFSRPLGLNPTPKWSPSCHRGLLFSQCMSPIKILSYPNHGNPLQSSWRCTFPKGHSPIKVHNLPIKGRGEIIWWKVSWKLYLILPTPVRSFPKTIYVGWVSFSRYRLVPISFKQLQD